MVHLLMLGVVQFICRRKSNTGEVYSLSFILSFFSEATKDRASSAELEGVNKLKQQLVGVGFAPEEVEYMVRKHTKKKSYTELDSSEVKKIRAALSEQLDIAYKCLNIIKE